MVVTAFAGSLLRRPIGDDGTETGVKSDVGNRRLATEKSSPCREVCIQRGEASGGFCFIFGGRSNVGARNKPLLDFGFLAFGIVSFGEDRQLAEIAVCSGLRDSRRIGAVEESCEGVGHDACSSKESAGTTQVSPRNGRRRSSRPQDEARRGEGCEIHGECNVLMVVGKEMVKVLVRMCVR